MAQELKEAKEQDSATTQPPSSTETKKEDGPQKRAFVYVFRLMDPTAKMYLAYGSSMKSEKEASDSARLDRYYSI